MAEKVALPAPVNLKGAIVYILCGVVTIGVVGTVGWAWNMGVEAHNSLKDVQRSGDQLAKSVSELADKVNRLEDNDRQRELQTQKLDSEHSHGADRVKRIEKDLDKLQDKFEDLQREVRTGK